MNILGFSITRAGKEKTLSPPVTRGGWFPLIREPYAGAWQKNVSINRDAVLSNHAVFACQTLIAGDIAKLRVKLVAREGEIWREVSRPAYSPVLRKPNGFQNRIQFLENWVLSKLQHGNTYVLKRRDNRNVVTQLYVLDPNLVRPLISDEGEIFYELNADRVTGIERQIVVPAREIIHDRFNCLFHPLVGLSPIFANGLAATQGLSIQNNSAAFFQNGSQPGGLLIAPSAISKENAAELKEYWEANYTGANAGRIAVLGDGLQYQAMATKAVDAQLIEQLKWTAEVVCSTYHVPPYKIGIGQQPTYNNVQALNVEYYSQCLQVLIESIEVCLDEGLGTGENLGTEFDIENLLRMDGVALMEMLDKGRNYLSPDEGRAKLGLGPTEGGDHVYRQQQDYSLAALAKRDAKDDPFGKSETPRPPSEDATDPAAIMALAEGIGRDFVRKAA